MDFGAALAPVPSGMNDPRENGPVEQPVKRDQERAARHGDFGVDRRDRAGVAQRLEHGQGGIFAQSLRFFERGFLERLLPVTMGHRGVQLRHQAAQIARKKDAGAAQSGRAVGFADPVFDAFPQKMRVVGGNQRIAAPKGLGVVAPRYEGGDGLPGAGPGKPRGANLVVVDMRQAAVVHEAIGLDACRGERHVGRFERAHGFHDGLPACVEHEVHVRLVKIPPKDLVAPDAHGVRGLVDMGRGQRDQVQAEGVRKRFPDLDEPFVRDADAVDRDHHAGNAVIAVGQRPHP